ncbi:hypothetical protein [Paenibacillus sp. Leaf72]|uniref:hypothetical protein n=1 Tax=Paenibacillus sp. Leaf72 TaxID=1736234 RepID=UPI0006FE5F04|nr:hypothetical protein [Paenibacillus sp. Leaf72]KQN96921.1 hypothetical protein ASF12_22900 [Paenibacillus sp. Leaf72]
MSESIKLSVLAADTILGYEDARYTLTAEELRQKLADGEYTSEITWYVATGRQWAPDAKKMVEQYIENENNNDLYEGWDARAYKCMKPEHYERIQIIMDEAFKSTYATQYWTLEGPIVEIDV